MASKVFLDANILLDFTLKRENYKASKELIQKIIDRQIQAFITPSIVHIVGYWLVKAYTNSQAKKILLALLDDIQVIDCNHEVTLNALNSQISDIEDALQYYTALQHRLDYFITRDQRLHKAAIPALPIFFPQEFLKLDE